ncbi:hypothetical protein [Alicyclobacillus dauci]|uniref:Uncharacterized protein n=1 Tax=Alicyclobacillus dauci TaxID=1475485 RepID=A0ABY6Z9K1_9BACL|nr:hypothetical protein [Alicyclobacillus dauci]WAH39489.1 hypothetical protein NZD86_24280 [Alicyclobacillus dauci]WAH39549.1 hypothetical protein NZD86_23980 [Alicyclobacillus dauci]
MRKPVVIDMHEFVVNGKVRRVDAYRVDWHQFTLAAGSMGVVLEAVPAFVYAGTDPAVTVTASEGAQLDSMHFNADASWADYVIPLIRHQALPLAVTMVCWAGLEMILRRPSSALDRAKWAIGGYIGMQFVLPFIRHLGHQFGDV